MSGIRACAGAVAVWVVLIAVVVLALGAAAASPLLAWREPIYIGAGFAGVCAFALLLFQPLAAVCLLPGLSKTRAQRIHRWIGALLVLLVLLHVAGLWFTSPPDVIDALLFRSPTPFSLWGVLAMWGLLATAALYALRASLRWRPRLWRLIHRVMVGWVVAGSVLHALLIEGTMEPLSKIALCVALVGSLLVSLYRVSRGLES